MRNIRVLLSVVVVALLCLGYGASQWAALTGTAPQYAVKVDCLSVQWLSLGILALCVVLALIKDNEADEP